MLASHSANVFRVGVVTGDRSHTTRRFERVNNPVRFFPVVFDGREWLGIDPEIDFQTLAPLITVVAIKFYVEEQSRGRMFLPD